MNRFLGAALGLLLAFFGPAAIASPDLHDADSVTEAVRSDRSVSFKGYDAKYRAAMAGAPDDVELAIARCRFLEDFENAIGLDVAEDLDRCRKHVAQRWPKSLSARIYHFEWSEGEDVASQAEDLWNEEDGDWTDNESMRLATRLHELYEDSNEDKAGFFAYEAARFGNQDLVGEGIAYLDDEGDREKALKLVRKSKPAPDRSEAWKRVDALIDLGEAKLARQELDRSIAAGVEVAAWMKVKAYLGDKDLAAANKAGRELGTGTSDEYWRMELALANGDLETARGLVSFDEEAGFERYSKVVAKDRLSAFSPSLFPFTLLLVAFWMFIAALFGLVLLPVHYRGLALRLGHRTPKPLFEGIDLRHAWLALCAAFLVPMIAGGVFDPSEIPGMLVDGVDLRRPFLIDVIGSLAAFAVLIPWLSRLGLSPTDGRRLLSWRIFGLVFACYLLVNGVEEVSDLLYDVLVGDDPSNGHTKAVKSLLEDGLSSYGIVTTLFLMAVLTPIVEEIVFRGMLLAGMARHISFGWANTLQALMFVAVHGDPPGIPFYLAMGLLAGWLTRRYRSVLPAIVLHGLINGSATMFNVYS